MSTRSQFRRNLLLVCLVAGVAVSTACSDQAPPQAAPQAGNVAGGPGQAGPTPTALPTRAVTPRASIAADGVLALSAPAIPVSFELNAKVLGVPVRQGQQVKKGELLGRVDDTVLQDALADAQAQLDLLEAQVRQGAAPASEEDIKSAKAAVSGAWAQYNLVKKGVTAADIEQAEHGWNAAKESMMAAKGSRDTACSQGLDTQVCQQAEASLGNAYEGERAAYDRYQTLLQPASRDKLAQAYAGVASAQARLDALLAGQTEEQKKLTDAQLTQSRATVARARKNLSKASLVSPCDCTVQAVYVSEGGNAAVPAFTLLDLSSIRFQTTNLSERDLTSVAVGTQATVRLKAYDKPFTGQVSAILPLASAGQGDSSTATFTVLIQLDATDVALLPGMTGQAEIAVK